MEIVIDEETFLKQQDYLDCILGKKFYETKMPLITYLVIKKGNLWRVSKQMSTYGE